MSAITDRCSGCDCPLEVHVKNVQDNVICLTSWTSYDNLLHHCDCINGISKSADRFRAEEERKRKETMAWVESIVNRNQHDETAKSIPCS